MCFGVSCSSQLWDHGITDPLGHTVVTLLLLSSYQIIQVRPPQPPVYFFVIDVSEPAIASGMLTNTANAIKLALDDLPGGNRTQIGALCCSHVWLLACVAWRFLLF